MVLALLFGSYYAAWVYFLRCVIQVFTFLSLLVSVDRLLNVLKYCFIRGRAKLTGHLPQHNWNFKPLPEDPHEFPKVRCSNACGGNMGSDAVNVIAELHARCLAGPIYSTHKGRGGAGGGGICKCNGFQI